MNGVFKKIIVSVVLILARLSAPLGASTYDAPLISMISLQQSIQIPDSGSMLETCAWVNSDKLMVTTPDKAILIYNRNGVHELSINTDLTSQQCACIVGPLGFFAVVGEGAIDGSMSRLLMIWAHGGINPSTVYEIPRAVDACAGVAYSSDSFYLVVAGNELVKPSEASGMLHVLRPAVGQHPLYKMIVAPHFDIRGLALLDRRTAAVIGKNPAGHTQVKIWDITTGALIRTVPVANLHNSDVLSVAGSVDGLSLAINAGDETKIYDVTYDAYLKILIAGSHPFWSPDGNYVITCDGKLNHMRISSIYSDHSIPFGAASAGDQVARWSPDGRHIATQGIDATERNVINIWQVSYE